ncbi:class I SAM-dependent methyltransferase [Ruegeria arenilitoris]|uniref:class I SAM-dependent methyltransferase n=1 Tax=Ruegeria arenilitoris TaxID=1173585 RepID=UPI00147CC8BF|nr:methyltransferase domain-containing protein [Ruegeria arenilitoris]
MSKDAASAGQVSKTAAEIYDEFFVPALFGEWAGRLCERAKICPGHAVLDVACGTGATTRDALARVGPAGHIVGLDRNPDMLNVACRSAPDIEWAEGRAEALPYADSSFDVVLCQFGLMFFDDRRKALEEMGRVVRSGGRIAVSVWDDADNSPGYARMIDLIDELFGAVAANALRAPFILGHKPSFVGVLEEGGLRNAAVTTVTGTAQFASIREWVRMDVRGWTLADLIDDAGYEALVAEAEKRLGQFAAPDGSVEFPAPAHLAVWAAD